ncbi:MAG: hypothetical protein ACLU6H_06400 [Lachnospiraceae bacterium]
MKNRHYQDMLCAVRLTAAVLAAVCISQPIGTFAQELSLDAAVVNIGGEPEEQTEAQELTGSWSVDSAWVQTKAEDEEERWTYKQSGAEAEEDTSTIVCSYLDTNYSVLEYEQLRDMLTNNAVYSNADAQISTSAAYTDAKDYLYMLTVEPSGVDYQDIYYYVVGDRRCFCVEVREYQAEADALEAAQKKTPSQTGQDIAMKFTWNMVG